MRAKEEMMQGIQIVKEMAQQELSSQKAAYESKIKVLEAELVGGGAAFDRRCDWFPSPCSSAIPGASGIYISGSPEDVHWYPRGRMVGSCKDFLSSRLINYL